MLIWQATSQEPLREVTGRPGLEAGHEKGLLWPTKPSWMNTCRDRCLAKPLRTRLERQLASVCPWVAAGAEFLQRRRTYYISLWGFPINKGSNIGVLMVRVKVYWGLFWGFIFMESQQ